MVKTEDSSQYIGQYNLEISPNYGLMGKWEIPIKRIKFQINTNNPLSYKVEKPPFSKRIITLKNHKRNEFLILSKDLNLSEMDSTQFRIIKELNYKFISIDSIVPF